MLTKLLPVITSKGKRLKTVCCPYLNLTNKIIWTASIRFTISLRLPSTVQCDGKYLNWNWNSFVKTFCKIILLNKLKMFSFIFTNQNIYFRPLTLLFFQPKTFLSSHYEDGGTINTNSKKLHIIKFYSSTKSSVVRFIRYVDQ